MQALAFPQPSFDPLDPTMKAILDLQASNKTSKETKKKETYSSITEKFAKDMLNKYGYTKSQIETIQKNYKKIKKNPDGTYKYFKPNGKEQSLGGMESGSLASMIAGLGGLIGTRSDAGDKVEYGYKKQDFSRGPVAVPVQSEGEKSKGYQIPEVEKDGLDPDVKDYYTYLSQIGNQNNISSFIQLPYVTSLKSVMGELYNMYKSQLKQYGSDIMIHTKIKPVTDPQNGNTKSPDKPTKEDAVKNINRLQDESQQSMEQSSKTGAEAYFR